MRTLKELLPVAVPANQLPVAKQSRSINTIFQKSITGRKLGWCPDDDLKNALKYVYLLLGIKAEHFPVGIDKEFLHQYIRSNYSGHTPAEIMLAFDMAIKGELDVKTELYNNSFSVAYFVKIMTAYRNWAREEYKQTPPEEKVYTPDELLEIDLAYAWAKLFNNNLGPFKLQLWQKAN